jgi:hypothetical protein
VKWITKLKCESTIIYETKFAITVKTPLSNFILAGYRALSLRTSRINLLHRISQPILGVNINEVMQLKLTCKDPYPNKVEFEVQEETLINRYYHNLSANDVYNSMLLFNIQGKAIFGEDK